MLFCVNAFQADGRPRAPGQPQLRIEALIAEPRYASGTSRRGAGARLGLRRAAIGASNPKLPKDSSQLTATANAHPLGLRKFLASRPEAPAIRAHSRGRKPVRRMAMSAKTVFAWPINAEPRFTHASHFVGD